MDGIKSYETMAKLNFSETERERAVNCADMLIKSFELLDKIDTRCVMPLISVLDIKNIMREDAVIKNITRDELLSNAPEQYEGYFQVPRTLD